LSKHGVLQTGTALEGINAEQVIVYLGMKQYDSTLNNKYIGKIFDQSG
jgi:hypothetical protein